MESDYEEDFHIPHPEKPENSLASVFKKIYFSFMFMIFDMTPFEIVGRTILNLSNILLL